MNIIIEGLTGAGKSQIISHLKKNHQVHDFQIIYESETFGELLDELDSEKSDKEKIYRLYNCLEQIKKYPQQKFILERFHFSYFPFLNDWKLYEAIDQELKDLNFMIILLTYNEVLIEQRALNHQDVLNANIQEALLEYFGSKENALAAYKQSQDKRIECLKYTKLPHLMMDTSDMKWEEYAEEIFRFMER